MKVTVTERTESTPGYSRSHTVGVMLDAINGGYSREALADIFRTALSTEFDEGYDCGLSAVDNSDPKAFTALENRIQESYDSGYQDGLRAAKRVIDSRFDDVMVAGRGGTNHPAPGGTGEQGHAGLDAGHIRVRTHPGVPVAQRPQEAERFA